jgi:hypothetical protein
MQALAALDEMGLILGPGESCAAFADRLRALQTNLKQLQSELDAGGCELGGIRLRQENAIPRAVFKAAHKRTREQYGFSTAWVPGFFSNDRMGLLFAGCALYPSDHELVVFVIRDAFRRQEKWFLYSRTELIAHEQTHVAHVAFNTPAYEEYFAFRGSESRFRRLIGGVFRRPRDSYLMLGAVFCALAAQVVNYWGLPRRLAGALPVWLILLPTLLVLVWLGGRHLLACGRAARARRALAPAFGRTADAVLFRCTEAEIAALARLAPGELDGWLAARRERERRWDVICHRFHRGSTIEKDADRQ